MMVPKNSSREMVDGCCYFLVDVQILEQTDQISRNKSGQNLNCRDSTLPHSPAVVQSNSVDGQCGGTAQSNGLQ